MRKSLAVFLIEGEIFLVVLLEPLNCCWGELGLVIGFVSGLVLDGELLDFARYMELV